MTQPRCSCGKYKRANRDERYIALHALLRSEIIEEHISANMDRTHRHRIASQEIKQQGAS